MSARASRRAGRGLNDRIKNHDATVSSNSKRDSFNPKSYHKPGSLNPRKSHAKSINKKRGKR